MIIVKEKQVLIKGETGDRGEQPEDTSVPISGVIAFNGDTIPEGYVLIKEEG